MHERNFHRHGHEPYLNYAFFEEIARTLGDALMVKLASRGDTPVAAAIFLASSTALYGRYWGAIGDFHSLHFETCYHQGIEYCIERGLARFEPGTQGEHKIVRGFEPSPRIRRTTSRTRASVKPLPISCSASAWRWRTTPNPPPSHVPFRRG